MYRVLKPLSHKGERIEINSIIPLDDIPQHKIDILVERGAVALINSPPLAIIPGWSKRAEKLETHDIITASQFLMADISDLAEVLERQPRTVVRYKDELKAHLVPEGKERHN